MGARKGKGEKGTDPLDFWI